MSNGRTPRLLVLYAQEPGSATLSYQVGWPAAFLADGRVDAVPLNVSQRSAVQRLQAALRVRRRYDAIVVLHSVFTQAQMLVGRLLDAVARNGAPVVYFAGNEYKNMPEKMAFAEALGARLLVSQTDDERVHGLYAARLGIPAVGILGGGLDPEVFRPTSDFWTRPIDVGMRAYDEPIYFGHQDRRTLAAAVEAAAPRHGLSTDISFDAAERFTREQYAAFLNRCKAQLGTEGGSDYFDLDDRMRARVNAYVDEHQGATLAELAPLFAAETDPVSCRVLTGRHVEAAGTKTLQILFRGRYHGLFLPDEHYVPVERDLSDLDAALDKLGDEAYCRRLVENAHATALAHFTYDALVGELLEAMRMHGLLS